MPFLFRTAVIVSRKQPYIDWANSLRDPNDDKDILFPPELEGRREIYLGPHSDLEQTLDQALSEIWEDIFEEELFGWSTDERQWPSTRSREMFDAWFETELADSIVDLAPDDPLTEDDVDLADLDEAMRTCAWCSTELDIETGRSVGFKLPDRDRLREREGRTLLLLVGRQRVLTGVITPEDSEPARDGADLMFRACSRSCEKRLQRAVPGGLRNLERLLARPDHDPQS